MIQQQDAQGTAALKSTRAQVGSLEPLLTTEQAAEVLGVRAQTLHNDRAQNTIGVPFVRIGGRTIRYRQCDLRAFIEAHTLRAAA